MVNRLSAIATLVGTELALPLAPRKKVPTGFLFGSTARELDATFSLNAPMSCFATILWRLASRGLQHPNSLGPRYLSIVPILFLITPELFSIVPELFLIAPDCS